MKRLAALLVLAPVLLATALAQAQAQAQAQPQSQPQPQPQPRPQMSDADAARHRIEDYLAQGPAPWQPAPPADRQAVASWRADFTVAADGRGSHRSLQAAIDAVPAAGATAGARRHYIRVRPGSYREALCIFDKAPITLYGEAADAALVTIVEGRWNAQARPAGSQTPCNPGSSATWGTSGSASVSIVSDDVHLAHLTIANDAMDAPRDGHAQPGQAGQGGGAQAVALLTRGDRILLDDMRLLGHQDTFHASRLAGVPAARVLVRRSLIAGDVDFVFGSATLVIDGSRLLARAGRRAAGHGGFVLAPSTAANVSLGFLVVNSRFVADAGVAAGSISIGRAWDAGVRSGQWQPGVSPNGQALVRDSVLGRHIGPWAASTSGRPFSASGPVANRLSEYRNQQADDAGPDADPDPPRPPRPAEAPARPHSAKPPGEIVGWRPHCLDPTDPAREAAARLPKHAAGQRARGTPSTNDDNEA